MMMWLVATEFRDETDKGGKPYFMHCYHVMNKLKYEDDEELMIIGLGHDLLEDTHVTPNDLADMGFSLRVITGIIDLTHKKDESYWDYILRVEQNPDAVKVKLQDLRHNSDVTRMKNKKLREKDHERIAKYHKAYAYLSSL